MAKSFIDSFKRDIKDGDGISSDDSDPRYFISYGNFVINKIMSGKYMGGIPQGMGTLIAGPSASGKSFLIANLVREAQAKGFGIIILDSERALTKHFMTAAGVNTDAPDYLYYGIVRIDNAIKLISTFIKSYRASKETTKFLIILDSMDAMLTVAQQTNYAKGETKGEMGQKAKQLKDMLAPITQDLKDLDISLVATKQVYRTQDPILAKNPMTEFKITDAIKYPFAQILLISQLMLKNDTTKKYEGIILRAFGHKARFTKPLQRAVVEVPYDVGMDPFNGLLDVAAAQGVVIKNGGWYNYGDLKFQKNNFKKYQDEILAKLIELEDSGVVDIAPDPTLYMNDDSELSPDVDKETAQEE